MKQSWKLNKRYYTKIISSVFLLFFVCSVFGQIAKTNQNKDQKAEKLFDEARQLASQGSLKAALSKFEQVRKLYQELDDRISEAFCLGWLGKVNSLLGNKAKALENFNQALDVFNLVNFKEGQADSLHEIAGIYDDIGEKSTALKYFAQALLLRRETVDKRGEAMTLTGIGKVYDDLGEKLKALENYNLALVILKEIKDVEGEAATLSNIGFVFLSLGDQEKALDYFKKSLPLRKQINDKSGEAATIAGIASIYQSLGEKQKALESFQEVLLLYKQIGDKRGEAETLNNIGGFYNETNERKKALEYFQQSLPLRRQVGDKRGEADSLINIGGFYYYSGEYSKAIDYFVQVLPIARQLEDKNIKAVVLNNIMFSWEALGKNKYAILFGKESVITYQQLRTNIIGLDKDTQKIFLKSIEKTYHKLASILISEGRFAESQQILNLFKDQQFFDFNQDPDKPIKQIIQTPREIEQNLHNQQVIERIGKNNFEVEKLKRSLANRKPTSVETTRLKKLETDLKSATDDFLAVLNQAETEFSKAPDEKDKVGDVPDTREMQTTLRNLNQQTGQKTVAVYTLVGEDGFRALIVSSDGIKAVSSPIKGTELNDKALKLWGLLQSDKYDTTVLSKQIYDDVFKTIEAELPKDTTTIMWSLDGNLRYIPMSALWDGNKFLAERYNHVIFTRADSERLTRNVNPNWTGTGFGTTQAQTVELLGSKIGFSGLPGVKEELAEIFKSNGSPKGILTGEVLPDAKFTKANFIESLKQKRPLVHIASHFSFRPGDEARSFLLLGDGTPFTLNDMKKETNLFEGVDLLTLSACNTAATQQDANGREIDGFAELAQRLGAGAVMATLWQVSDASTPWLMREFYEKRQSEKLTKAEALRKAQLALLSGTAKTGSNGEARTETANTVKIVIKENAEKTTDNLNRGAEIVVSPKDAPLFKKDAKKPFAHPYYWSPFVLYGNWK